MWRTRIEPDKPGCARRTFECPRCKHRITEVIELENAASWRGRQPLAAKTETARARTIPVLSVPTPHDTF